MTTSLETASPSQHDKIKILHVAFTMKPRGTETWLMNILRRIDRTRFQMDFVTVRGEEGFYDQEIKSLGGKLHRLYSPVNKYRFLSELRYLLNTEKYDIIHAHPYHFCGMIMREAKNAGVPVRITHSHTDRRQNDRESNIIKQLYTWLMKILIKNHSTHGLAASEKAAISLFGQDWEKDTRWRLLFCGIDLSPFSDNPNETLKKQFSIPNKAKVITHVGGLYFEKNHEFILRLFQEMKPDINNYHLLIVGDGPLKDPLKEKALRLGIDHRVTFTGARNDVPDILKLSDLFIFPSLFEGLGLSLVEAQAAGVRCLIADTIPPEAIINPEIVKTLSLDDDFGLWLEHAKKLIHEDTYTLEKALEIAQKSIFNIDHNVKELSTMYEEMVKKAHA